MGKTFKDIEQKSKIIKPVKKAGLSLCIIFSKDELKRYGLDYEDSIDLSNAEIIKKGEV